MSYSITYEQYAPLLRPDNNEDVVKNAFQEIFESLVEGRRMPRSKRKVFIQDVGTHINSKSQKIRKWAYHCACFYQDESVLQSIQTQLAIEQNTENIIWALTALTVKYDDIVKLKQCVGRRHDEFVQTISENYLIDALILFGGVVEINPHTILLTSNSADLAALTKIYAYKELVRNKYSDVTVSIIQELQKSDDPYVREYAYWSQALRGTKGNFLEIPDDINIGVRKWQIALQIQNGDEDFVVSSLKPLGLCPEKISSDIKSGILRGLNKIAYSEKYVPYVNSWFERETDDSVVFLLIDFIIANCYMNKKDGTYFDVIRDSLDDHLLVIHIVKKIEDNPQYELCISKHEDRYILDFKKQEGLTVIKQDVNVGGTGNSVAVAGSNSTATVVSTHQDSCKLDELIKAVREQASEGLSEEEKKTVDEGLSFIESETKSSSPRKTIIKGILDGIYAIKGTVQFASAVAALIKFFEG